VQKLFLKFSRFFSQQAGSDQCDDPLARVYQSVEKPPFLPRSMGFSQENIKVDWYNTSFFNRRCGTRENLRS
jgi:hypothetical protein